MNDQPFQTFPVLEADCSLGFTVLPDGTAILQVEIETSEYTTVGGRLTLSADTARDFAERLTRSLQYAGNGPFGPGKDWHPFSGSGTIA